RPFVEAIGVGHTPAGPTCPELVEMGIRPAHGRLDHLVQTAQPDLERHIKAPKNLRLDVGQRDLQACDQRHAAISRSLRAPAQFHGSNSCRRETGVSEMRAMTSASHACGSMSFRFAVPIREYMKAARCPPRSDPAKSQDFLPRATPRRDLSAALLVRQTRPSSRNRVKLDQWFGDSR